jgi:hypothetical protein
MSEDLSEGEKGDGLGELVQSETPRKRFQRNLSNLEVWSDDKKEKKLYIVLVRYGAFWNISHVRVYEFKINTAHEFYFYVSFNSSKSRSLSVTVH